MWMGPDPGGPGQALASRRPRQTLDALLPPRHSLQMPWTSSRDSLVFAPTSGSAQPGPATPYVQR